MDIKHHLEKHTDKLILELTTFSTQILPDSVRCIHVVLYSEALPHIPIRIFYLNRFKGAEEGLASKSILEDVKLLTDSESYVSREDAICDCLDLDCEAEQDSCMTAVDRKYDADNIIVAEWFAHCWLEAEANKCNKPAYLSIEDSGSNPIDLRTGKIIKHFNQFERVFDG